MNAAGMIYLYIDSLVLTKDESDYVRQGSICLALLSHLVLRLSLVHVYTVLTTLSSGFYSKQGTRLVL